MMSLDNDFFTHNMYDTKSFSSALSKLCLMPMLFVVHLNIKYIKIILSYILIEIVLLCQVLAQQQQLHWLSLARIYWAIQNIVSATEDAWLSSEE